MLEKTRFGLRGVGKETASHLAKLEIYSITDLLFHLPARYQDRTHIEPIRQLKSGHEAVVEGEIHAVTKPNQGRTKLICEFKDKTGVMYLRFFHLLPFQKEILTPGIRLRCFSTIRSGPRGFEMVHPEFQILDEGKKIPLENHLTPIYPATEGLSQSILRKLMRNALAWMENEKEFKELLPNALLQELSIPHLKSALAFVHEPPHDTPIMLLLSNKTIPQQRLIFEELLAHRIALLQMKKEFQSQQSLPLTHEKKLMQRFKEGLPFILTQSQERVAKEIQADLTRTYPMLRLVQGDVGSGKTVVAAIAMLQAVESNYQSALMAPTELLAEQHFRVFKNWFTPLGINVQFLSGQIKANEKRVVLDLIKNGEAQIVLGTHALIQEGVDFASLALVVIDEQHRFGVQQRALFREKGMQASSSYPHQLIMTATPIPRTLAMSFYANLDCSLIDELPPGRIPIVTSIISNERRHEVVARIREACQKGRQAYWVCPLIDESDMMTCQAASKTAEDLQALLPELQIGLIHGRLSAEKKEAVMRDFQTGKLHLLVATTVIEVGVDVPNASIMIIENAERLGLSQLHQLRGRVGRGKLASHCLLLYQHPLSELAKERLIVMRDNQDGFQIAQRDLELRGPGEVLGTKQTGELSFRIADLIRDSDLLPQIHNVADIIQRDYPDIIQPLIMRWLRKKEGLGKV